MGQARHPATERRTKRLRHESLGEFTAEHVVLQVAEAPDQKLVTFSPAAPHDRRLLCLPVSAVSA